MNALNQQENDRDNWKFAEVFVETKGEARQYCFICYAVYIGISFAISDTFEVPCCMSRRE